MRSIAYFLSYFLHPLFLPLYLSALFFKLSPVEYPRDFQHLFMLIVLFGTALIPLLAITIFRISGAISSFHMPNRAERRWPLVTSALFLFGTHYLLQLLHIKSPVESCILGCAISLLICSLFLEKIKISIHTLGAGGITAFFVWAHLFYYTNSILWIVASLLVSGLVGFARLTLNAHSEKEIYIGWGLGFAVLSFCLFAQSFN
jgi:hypothetical protein